MKPIAVIADKGYDSKENFRYVTAKGADPIILTRLLPKGQARDGIYSDSAPTCMGQVPMEYVRSDPEKGLLFRCRSEGCPLRERRRVLYCQDEVWENRQDDPRLNASLLKETPEWKRLYGLRQSIERIFKSLKQSRRLEVHCFRGLRKVAMHTALAVVVYQATVLYRLQSGQQDQMRWQYRLVA